MEEKAPRLDAQKAGNYSNRLFDLSGKVGIVTGATGAIGQTLAVGLATYGADLALSGRNQQKLDRVVKAIRVLGKEAVAVTAEVTRESDVQKLVARTMESFGRIDFLISSSGINILHPAVSYPADDFDRLMRTNALGTFICDREVGRVMIEQRHGKIINVSSVRGWFATSANVVGYSASKAAVNMITRSLACEWAKFNVNVNAIAPIMVEGGMHVSGQEGETASTDQRVLEGIVRRTPMKRLAKPEDLIGPTVFLA